MCPHLNKELNKSLNGGEGQLFPIEEFKLLNVEGTREAQKHLLAQTMLKTVRGKIR